MTIRVTAQLAVVVTTVASHLFSDEMGDFWRILLIFKLHFSHHQALVVTMKLVDFEGVVATLDEPAGLVDYAGFTELHELLSINEHSGSVPLCPRTAQRLRFRFKLLDIFLYLLLKRLSHISSLSLLRQLQRRQGEEFLLLQDQPCVLYALPVHDAYEHKKTDQ